MPMDEDLAAFFDVADFADAVTLDGHPVAAILHLGYDDVLGGIATHDAWARLPTASVGASGQHSVLVARGVTYRVRVVQPDSAGVCTLLLERQP